MPSPKKKSGAQAQTGQVKKSLIKKKASGSGSTNKKPKPPAKGRKKGSGRPPGAKDKTRRKKGGGRPPGAKNKTKKQKRVVLKGKKSPTGTKKKAPAVTMKKSPAVTMKKPPSIKMKKAPAVKMTKSPVPPGTKQEHAALVTAKKKAVVASTAGKKKADLVSLSELVGDVVPAAKTATAGLVYEKHLKMKSKNDIGPLSALCKKMRVALRAQEG